MISLSGIQERNKIHIYVISKSGVVVNPKT